MRESNTMRAVKKIVRQIVGDKAVSNYKQWKAGKLRQIVGNKAVSNYKQWKAHKRGLNANFSWRPNDGSGDVTARSSKNPLRDFFENRQQGHGVWKWNHYFDIYDRHFRRFRGGEVHVLEIGVFSGGSLEMWRDYFGPRSCIYGVDILPECRAYESVNVKIFIGDQGNRSFWHDIRNSVPALDIVIDDGGHLPEQQIVSLEELLPFMRPGGVYCCEDVHGADNQFTSYINGFAHKLNDTPSWQSNPDDKERRLVSRCAPFQAAINSIHLYPFMTVIEKNDTAVNELVGPMRGTLWQPY